MSFRSNYKPSTVRWLKYTGNKYQGVKYLFDLEIPEFDVCAEPCCGSCAVAFYYMAHTTNKTFKLNDASAELIDMLRKLYDEGVDALYNDPIYRQHQSLIRASEGKSKYVVDRKGAPKWKDGQYRRELASCYELMRRHTCEFSTVDCVSFMDALPKTAFVVFDPPYISLILKYKWEAFDIRKLVESIPKLSSFDHWILYNDEVSQYLACLQDIPTKDNTVSCQTRWNAWA
jgi:site-specific DNA-adenine methylase